MPSFHSQRTYPFFHFSLNPHLFSWYTDVRTVNEDLTDFLSAKIVLNFIKFNIFLEYIHILLCTLGQDPFCYKNK